LGDSRPVQSAARGHVARDRVLGNWQRHFKTETVS